MWQRRNQSFKGGRDEHEPSAARGIGLGRSVPLPTEGKFMGGFFPLQRKFLM